MKVSFILLLILIQGSYGSYIEYELLEKLFTNYSTDNRPVRFPNESLTVTMDLALYQIINLEEASEKLEVRTWRRLIWTDYQLQWTPAEYGDIQSITVVPSKIWTPDITLYNDVSLTYSTSGYEERFGAYITSDGTVHWSVPYTHQSSCKLDIRYFPYDKQQCVLKFGSWLYTKDKLNLENSSASADLDYYECNGEWELISMPVTPNAVGYRNVSIYVDLTYTMSILRKPLFYTFNLIFPCLLLTAVAMLMFLLPAESGEKLNLGVTILLAQIVFLLIVAQTVPAQSNSVPLAGQCLGASIALLGVSTAMTVLTLHIHHRGVLAVRLPKPLRIVFLDWLAVIVNVRKYVRVHNAVKKDIEMRMSKVQTGPEYNTSTPRNDDKINESTIHPQDKDGNILDSNNSLESVISRDNAPTSSDSHLAGISQILHDFHRSSINDEEQKDLASEWTLFAMVIDRLLFVIFVIATFITTSAILNGHPNYYTELPQPRIPCN